MLRPWVNNEDGPLCSCGRPTLVKDDSKGGFILLCFLHTREAGLSVSLPPEVPDNFEAIDDESVWAGDVVPHQATVAGAVGAFIPRWYAEHFAKVLKAAINNENIPEFQRLTLAGLYKSLRTAEAEPEDSE